ncbi:unnamed protein product [Linum tenue]|uniref:Uncharacterized protein n=1 Tax=Linum tenue TaxID=586396 RepID=A0AAV0LSQ2_9ROSI|nr:unnamed protein product [Linum tenue]
MTRYWRRGWVPDLNHLPPVDEPVLDGLIGFSVLPDSGAHSGGFTRRRSGYVEFSDDEIAVISPRTFAQAKCNVTRNNVRRLHDVLGEAAPSFFDGKLVSPFYMAGVIVWESYVGRQTGWFCFPSV